MVHPYLPDNPFELPELLGWEGRNSRHVGDWGGKAK
jgi:hypothetical protein